MIDVVLMRVFNVCVWTLSLSPQTNEDHHKIKKRGKRWGGEWNVYTAAVDEAQCNSYPVWQEAPLSVCNGRLLGCGGLWNPILYHRAPPRRRIPVRRNLHRKISWTIVKTQNYLETCLWSAYLLGWSRLKLSRSFQFNLSHTTKTTLKKFNCLPYLHSSSWRKLARFWSSVCIRALDWYETLHASIALILELI